MEIPVEISPAEIEQVATSLLIEPGTDRTPEQLRDQVLRQLITRAVVFFGIVTPGAVRIYEQARAEINHRPRLNRLPKARRTAGPGH